MPRTDVSMSAAEVASFIGSVSSAVVAANGAAGFVVELVSFVVLGDEIEFEGHEKLVAAINGDPRVCVTVEEFEAYEQLRGAVLHGNARVDRDGKIAVPITDDVVSFDFAKLTPKD